MYMNKARMCAYSAALRSVVTPNSTVVDIGTGTGIFALLACRYGACRVFAIEPDNSINLARELAVPNKCSDRLVCIQSRSTEVSLPERADVIISDLGGRLPLFGQHIPAIMDARDRFLVPGGTLIAQQDHLRAAIIETPAQYDKLIEPWTEDVFGLDLAAGSPLVTNTWYPLTDKKTKLLTRPATLAVFDYRTIAKSNMDAQAVWPIDERGTGHGAAVWFDRIVADGIKITTEPGAPKAINVSDIYGQGLFPWPKPVELEPGDRVSFAMKADLVKDDYIWRWETKVFAAGRMKAQFRQSSLHGHPLSPGSLEKRESEFVPAPNEEATIDAFIISRIDGHRSLRQAAQALAVAFPLRFQDWQDALSRVADVTARYSMGGERSKLTHSTGVSPEFGR
jgi:protein arginine N-methyltransferase 1